MPDGRRRSREHWTDTMEAGPPDPPAHVHRLPKSVRLALVGLVAAVLLVAVALGLMAVYVYQANQYVQGRGEYRDREAARMEAESAERNRRLACDMADQFPEGGWLDRLRDKYDCGPGIPIDQLPPDEQAKLRSQVPARDPEGAALVAPSSPAPFSGGAPISPAPQADTFRAPN